MPRKGRPGKRAPTAWESSAEFRAIGRAAITAYNELRRSLPKCGAARKADGMPCQRPGMANGRCHFHGGRVPKGKNWHKRQWPEKDGPAAEKRFHDKLKQINRQDVARSKRVAAMTDEERNAHEVWHKTHKPGSAASRKQAKHERDGARASKELMSRPSATSPELEAIQAKIRALEAKLAMETLFL